MTDLVLVNRLRQAYWPPWMSRWASTAALRATPRAYAPHAWRDRKGYDLGRVHALLLDLLVGRRLKPIEIDTSWLGYKPVGLTLLDGHHRFAAAVLADKERIPAEVGGWTELGRWLTGEREEWPL